MADFEKKMEEFDALLYKAKTEEEKADAVQKICLAFNQELKEQGMTEEQREEQLAEFMAMIMDIIDEAEETGAEAEPDTERKAELDN